MSFLNARTEIDGSLVDEVDKAVDNIVDDNLMFEINMLLAKMCDPYVPYNTGRLAHSKTVSPDGINYTAPYADEVYNGVNMNFRQDKHPFATARWDEAMLSVEGDLFYQKVGELIEQKVRRLYG